MCKFFLRITSQRLRVNNCGTFVAVVSVCCIAAVSTVTHIHACTCTHVPAAHMQQSFPRAKSRDSGRMARLFTLKGSKDNLPGLEKPSVPAIPDCFGGVSINTE